MLSDALRDMHLLLVVDNCEHLVSSCAELADGLLRTCPNVRVLATSREALAISGETILHVPSLSVPQTDADTTVESIAEFEAVQLFVERARAVLRGFALTSSNAPYVVNVCRRLDGSPLAIELAAARVSTLSVEEISERLDGALRLLVARNRSAPPRQRTLRATLDWSYGLLGEPERVLFERLSVFAGGWTLKAAEVVCAGPELASEDILDTLARLIEQSLVVCERSATESTRYRLLETVRQYAREQLTASGATEQVAEKHATYFLDMAEAAAPHLFGPHDQQYAAWLNQLELEHDNLRTALRWLVARGAVQQAQRLGGALRYFWFFQGHLTEGRAWLAELAAMPDSGTPSVERARVLAGAAILAVQHGDYETARSMAGQAEVLWSQLGNDVERGLALYNLGSAAGIRGERNEARALHEEAVRITQAAGRGNIAAHTVQALNLYGLSELAFGAGDYAVARARAEEAKAIARELGWTSPRNTPQIIGMLGEISLEEGDLSSARAAVEDSLVKARAIGWPWGVALALIRVANVAIEQHDIPRTITALTEAFAAFQPQANRAGFIACLECLAHLEASRGNAAAALRLAGDARTLRGTIHVQSSPTELRRLERWIASARTELGEARSQAILAEVRMIPVEQIIAEGVAAAADTPSVPTKALSSRKGATLLTQRELEVVALVAQGRTNLQIAETLVLSTRTVESHVRNAMAKLHLTSRVSLATWEVERRSSQ